MAVEKTDEGLNGEKFDYSSLSDDAKPLSVNISETEKQNVREEQVSGRYKAKIIAENIQMDQKEFDRYNPQFDKMISTGLSVTLRLPSEKLAVFNKRKLIILDQCIQELLHNAIDNSRAMKPAKPMQKKRKFN